MRFLRGFWRFLTAAKNATVNILFLVIVIALVFAIFSTDTPSVPESTALVIDPTGVIVEQKRVVDPINRFLSGGDRDDPETRLSDLKTAIEEGAGDDRVSALVLDLAGLAGAPMSMLQEIARDIEAFKETGKPVYAFGPGYTQGQYFLASHADHVYIDEHSFFVPGGVFLTGFGAYPTYFKSALDKLKLNFHIFRVGEYKTAVEPYTRDDMSEEAKEMNRDWIGKLWDVYADTIMSQREMSEATFDRYTNAYDTLLADVGNDALALAVQEGFVDELISRDEFSLRLLEIVGGENSDYHRIGFRDYLSATQPPLPVVNPAADKVAVITAKGTILDGEQPAGDIGSETISTLIDQARDDRTVKAIVLRIDSPGGSASASERIRAELGMAQSDGKPVVVSMSGAAASGGYWVSASANKIFAQPTTITGSIGTFLVFPTLDESLAEVGVYSDGVGTTSLSGSFNPLDPINPVFERTLQRSVENTYSRFVGIVAKGRDLSEERVSEIAKGRVWTGTQALELGLIDGIGTLEDAIESAALLADTADYEVLHLEKRLSPREQLLNEILNTGADVLAETFSESTNGLASSIAGLERLPSEMKSLLRMSRTPGIYLECLTCRALN